MLALEGEADPRPSRACRMPGAASARPATGFDLLRDNGVDDLVLAGGVRRRRSQRCGRTGGRQSSSPASATARSAMTGCCRRSSRSWSARGFASSAPISCSPRRALPDGPLGALRPDADARGRHRAWACASRARSARSISARRSWCSRAWCSASRRSRAPTRCCAAVRRLRRDGAGRRAGEDREAAAGTARRPADDRRRGPSRSPPQAGCAASPSRPVRRLLARPRRGHPRRPTRPGSSSSASPGMTRRRRRAAHLHRRRRALGRCARRGA